MSRKNTTPKKYQNEDKKMDELLFEENEVVQPKIEFTVKVTHPSLRMRKAPTTQAEIVGLITDEGLYKIIDEANGWGQLENGNWIMLTYTQRLA